MAADSDSTSTAQVQRNARYGLLLFALYFLLYAGFMAVSTLAPQQLAMPVLLGINLAIVYGFVLIVAALLLALIYMVLCRRPLSASSSAQADSKR